MLVQLVFAGIGSFQAIFPLTLGKRVFGLVLDTVFGPAESCEYTGKTTPSGPPPYIS